jgi:hypothetical protein
LAIVHGGFAHAFFALIASLTLVTSPSWRAAVESIASPEALRLRRLACYTAGALYVQVLLGTLVTHLGARLDAHIFVAGLISVAVIRRLLILPGRTDWASWCDPQRSCGALDRPTTLGLGA